MLVIKGAGVDIGSGHSDWFNSYQNPVKKRAGIYSVDGHMQCGSHKLRFKLNASLAMHSEPFHTPL